MGTYLCRKEGVLTAQQMRLAELMFRGFSDKEIIEEMWPYADDKAKKNKRSALKKLREKEEFQAYYKSIITEWSVHNVGKALTKLGEQIDSDKPWIANKAANDVLQHSKQFIAGDDDNTVVVKFDGMPELGAPETE